MKPFFQKIKTFAIAHKIWSAVIVIAVIGGGYAVYEHVKPAAAPEYIVSRVRMGSIIQTVTGTGQVAAANQLNVTSQVSGTIETVNVKVGEHVDQGDLIATIDPTNALNSLDSAKIAYDKLTEAPEATDLSNAEDSVTQSYTTAFNAMTNAMADMLTIKTGLNVQLNGTSGYVSDVGSNASILETNLGAGNYLVGANTSYDKAINLYNEAYSDFQGISANSSTSTIASVLDETHVAAVAMAQAVNDVDVLVNFLAVNDTSAKSSSSGASTAESDMQSWSSSIDSDVASLLSAQTGITSAQNALTNLVIGPDVNDVASAQLSLQEAQQTYDNYFIRAPFSGTIGLLPANVYQQASGGTAIATVIGDQKLATLTLDEVDAASVKVGDPVSLTFNAINNFTATGTVEEIDQVGTVVSGVVSYGVKVTINTADSRINPGMSVNATITTNEIDNVLVVPAAAVKTQGSANYVQVLATSTVNQYLATLVAAAGAGSSTARTTHSFASSTAGFASSTAGGGYAGATGSTTRQFAGGAIAGARSTSVTISSATAPLNQAIVVGASDGTNTQVLKGVAVGEWVVTKTIAASAVTTTTAAPSLLSSLSGGARAGGGGFAGGAAGGGAARTTAAAPAAATR